MEKETEVKISQNRDTPRAVDKNETNNTWPAVLKEAIDLQRDGIPIADWPERLAIPNRAGT